jgi:hypothetical protein
MRLVAIFTSGPGKGSNIWLLSGFVLADEECKTITLHDWDILN